MALLEPNLLPEAHGYGQIDDARALWLDALNNELSDDDWDKLSQIARGSSPRLPRRVVTTRPAHQVSRPRTTTRARATSSRSARKGRRPSQRGGPAPTVSQAAQSPERDQARVASWARKLGIYCPCVQMEAMAAVESLRRHPRLDPSFVVAHHHDLPRPWDHRMATLNDKKVMNVSTTSPEHRLEQDAVLAPIAYYPGRESRKDFLDRARRHMEAREQGAEDHNLTLARGAPEIKRDTEWLVLYQYRKMSFLEIARQSGPSMNPEAVRKAVRVAAERLQLKLRQPPRGRPRRVG